MISATALLVVAFGIGLWANVVGLPAPLTIDEAQAKVTSVAPGSYVWLLGVRAGTTAVPWAADAPNQGYTIGRPDGSEVDIAARAELTTTALFLAFGLLALGVLLRTFGIPGWPVALGLSAAISLGPLTPAVGYPTALVLGMIPPAVTVLDELGSSPDLGRQRLAVILLLVISLGVLISTLAWQMPDLDWTWDLVWKMPGIAVLAIGVLSLVPATRRALANPGAPRDKLSGFMAEAFPIARSSRLAGSATERRRLATEMHNSILPQLGQAILEIDSRDPAGRLRLTNLVGQIRRSLSEVQVTVLERAGLVAAIEGYVQNLDIPLDLREQRPARQRAPRPVEFAAYRVAQLAIANAVQHSGADAIRVEVSESERELTLKVVDDGVGMDELAERVALAAGHIGLAEMRAQAEEVSADLAVRSAPDMGTSVEFRWTH